MESEETLVLLNKQEAKKLLDKWLIFRNLKGQNQKTIYNHLLPYSGNGYVQFSNMLIDLENNEIDNAITKLEAIKEWSEAWLNDEWLSLGRSYQIESLFTKKDWNLVQSTFEVNVNGIIENLNNLKDNSDEYVQIIIDQILRVITYFKEEETTLKEYFKAYIRAFRRLLENHMNEMGELAAKSLYGKICLEIPRYEGLKGKKEQKPKDIKSILENLWTGLKEGDDKRCLDLAKKLRKFSQQNVNYYTRLISDLRYKRINESNNIEKLELLMRENEFTTEMRRNGMCYSVGLYFQNVLELSLAGSNKIAKREYRKAKELSFELKDETPEVTIRELLENPDIYDGKNVKVSGLVANINENKLSRGKGEVVFITFELLHDGHSMEFYFPRNWLTDNGLKEESFAVFAGTFNKECPKSKKPDVHVIRLGPGKRKNTDWVSRCKWLIHEWWDGYTGRATANWTLSTLTPASDLINKKVELGELTRIYPSIQAGFETLKSIMFGGVRRKLDINYGSTLEVLFMRYTIIDLILYLTLMSVIKEKIAKNIPSLRWYTTESQWTKLVDNRSILMSKIEAPELELGEDINWLINEIESSFKEVEYQKLDVQIQCQPIEPPYDPVPDWPTLPDDPSSWTWQDIQDFMDAVHNNCGGDYGAYGKEYSDYIEDGAKAEEEKDKDEDEEGHGGG